MQRNEVQTLDVTKVVLKRSEDKTITLPKAMTYREARQALTHMEEAEQAPCEIRYDFDCFPTEGLVAFHRAVEKIFGFYGRGVRAGGFFQPPKKDGRMVTIQTGVGKHIQVMMGAVTIPGIDGQIVSNVQWTGSRWKFVITGETIKKYEQVFTEVAEETRRIINEESIYRGQVIEFNFGVDEGDPLAEIPRFLDITGINVGDLVLNADVQRKVDNNLFSPLRNYSRLKENGVPFKRGVLLAGDYGCGKTMSALTTAVIANREGITFLKVGHAAKLAEAVQFARQYQPCVVFCEDIDRATSGGRTAQIDHLLNTVDGIDSKHTEIMVVLTSNDIQGIHEAMLRPGRLDAKIWVDAPDAESVRRLLRQYGKGLIDPEAKLDGVGEILAGRNPAAVRDCVERAKLAMLDRTKSTSLLADPDLESAARDIVDETELVERTRPVGVLEPIEKFGVAVGKEMASGTLRAIARSVARGAAHTPDSPTGTMVRDGQAFGSGTDGKIQS